MSHSETKYSLLEDQEKGNVEKTTKGWFSHWNSLPWTLLLSVALLVSISVNLSNMVVGRCRTETAKLSWDTFFKIHEESVFNHPNREIEDAAWASEMVKPWRFTVALDDSYADAHGLQRAMRWPWDQNKGIYVLNSGHQLHCLNLLREAANDVDDGLPPRWSHRHQLHCIELLLQNVICHADDTLLYTGFVGEQANSTQNTGGLGTARKCRDWKKLRAWADEHSACYNPHLNENDPHIPEKERYRDCPDEQLVLENVWSQNTLKLGRST